MGSGDDSRKPPDEARKAILARRANFVAVALTTAGLTVGACDTQPQVCLKVAPSPQPPPEDAGVDAGESPTSAQEDAGAPASSADAGDLVVPPAPTVCLEFAMPPRDKPQPKAPPKKKPSGEPRVCLNMDTVEGDE